MEFNEYQKKAKKTDQFTDKNKSLASSMWNIQETLALLSRKFDENGRKTLDNEIYLDYVQRKLGDLTWYISNIATCHDLDFEDIIQANIDKCDKRWGKKKHKLRSFDEGFLEEEILPRKAIFRIKEVGNKTEIAIEGKLGKWFRIGDRVTDNNHEEDGYRFHDAIHLSFMTNLGWSPAMRSLLNRKRKSNPKFDEVEDGARAANLEESVSAMIFEFARENNWFENRTSVPLELLKMIDRITRNLEISEATFEQWENAILNGYEIFRQVRDNKGGYILIDMDNKQMEYSKTPISV